MADDSLKGAMLMQKAKSCWQEGLIDQALSLLRDALTAFKTADDARNTAACLQNMGMLLFSMGDAQSGINALKEALTIAQKHRYDDIAQALDKNLDAMFQSLSVNDQPPKKNSLSGTVQ